MPDTFTPEQISQILEEFFKVVGTRQYIGARYVPLFGRKDEESIEWDNTAPYEPLTVVLYQGNSYTSRQFVPVGVAITNQDFWAITGNYNAQIEMYRRETAAAREIADNALAAANDAQDDIDTLLPKADFSAENTVKKYVDDSVAVVQTDIDTLLPKADFSAENTVKEYVDSSIADAKLTRIPVNALDIGCKPESGFDNLQLMQDFFNENSSLYLPAGTYEISNTLVLPDNALLTGDKDAIIYQRNEGTRLGAAIAVCGDNVIIENIGVSYANPNRNFSTSTSNEGCIGISGYTYESAKLFARDEGALVNESHNNVIISRVHTDASYLVQAEPPANTTISNVYYDSLSAPNGVIGIGCYADDAVSNVFINNCDAAMFRLSTEYACKSMITNCVCEMFLCRIGNAVINNIDVRMKANSVVQGWIDAGTITETALFRSGGNNIISNVRIDGTNFTKIGFRLQSNGQCIVSNVVLKNLVSTVNPTFIESGTVPHMLCNCDFSQNTGDCLISARIQNVYYSSLTSSSNIILWNFERTNAIRFETGITYLNSYVLPSNLSKSVNRYHVRFPFRTATPATDHLSNEQTLATVLDNKVPSESVYAVGVVTSTAGVMSIATFELTNTGAIIFKSAPFAGSWSYGYVEFEY